MNIVMALLSFAVPILVKFAESKFNLPKQGDQKYSYVTTAVHDALDALGKHLPIPNWAADVEPGIEKLLSEAIEAEVEKIDPSAPAVPPTPAPASDSKPGGA